VEKFIKFRKIRLLWAKCGFFSVSVAVRMKLWQRERKEFETAVSERHSCDVSLY
jgi:hypothetical protein